MKASMMFRLTSAAILVQIALGGLVTFGFLDPLVHVGWGILVVVLAIVTVVSTLRLGSLDRQLRGVSFGILAALVVQIILGFSTLALESDVLAWVHLVLGVIIYAMALTGMSFAQRREFMSGTPAVAQPTV